MLIFAPIFFGIQIKFQPEGMDQMKGAAQPRRLVLVTMKALRAILKIKLCRQLDQQSVRPFLLCVGANGTGELSDWRGCLSCPVPLDQLLDIFQLHKW